MIWQLKWLKGRLLVGHDKDEWMQKEMEEFERYKRMGKFDNLNLWLEPVPGVASVVAIPINFSLPLLWLVRWGYIDLYSLFMSM